MSKPIANIKGVDHYSTSAAAGFLGLTNRAFLKQAETLGIQPDGWMRWGGPPIIDVWSRPTVEAIGMTHPTSRPRVEWLKSHLAELVNERVAEMRSVELKETP